MQLNLVRRQTERGLGLVELMVGITIGLIVAAGASMVAVNQINEHRQLMLEVQLQQDLRTAADLIQQDMRRAGYRGLGQNSIWQPASGVGSASELPAVAASANPYAALVKTDDALARTLTYSYAQTYSNFSDVPRDNEALGIQWDKTSQVLYLKLGMRDGAANWQPITDPESVRIIDFDITVTSQTLDIADFCDQPCSGTGCPQQAVRRVEFTIRGQARHDPNVIRTLSGVERIRTDALSGACPS